VSVWTLSGGRRLLEGKRLKEEATGCSAIGRKTGGGQEKEKFVPLSKHKKKKDIPPQAQE